MTQPQKRKAAKADVEAPVMPVQPKAGLKRREQQRAIETRQMIIRAALTEFAEKGFEAASIRTIAERTGLQHPLITYHYKTKDILWRAVAEHLFTEIRALWDENAPLDSSLSARDFVRAEFRTLLRFTMEYKDFHQFMLRENRPNNPRLSWIVETFLKPLLARVLPKIKEAQEEADLPPGDPILVNYMLVGITSVLSTLGSEIKEIAHIDPEDPDIVDAYWKLVDITVFGRKLYGR
jgi:AcrR family transcriptional regulator